MKSSVTYSRSTEQIHLFVVLDEAHATKKLLVVDSWYFSPFTIFHYFQNLFRAISTANRHL